MRKAMVLMGSLDDSDVGWLASNGSGLHAARGSVLVRHGQPLESLFIVLDGRLGVMVDSKLIATLLAGDVVGEISFVDSRPPLADVQAIDDSRLLAVPKAGLQRKLDADKKFAANFYRAIAVFLADRLRTTTGRLGYGNASQDTAQDDDDLGDDLIDVLSIGTRRFDELLRRVTR